MNSFQILGKEDQPLTLAALDSQASGFWMVDPDSEYYAQPEGNPLGNWFDTIGWSISKQTNYLDWGLNTWNTIKSDMLTIHVYSCVILSAEEAGVRMYEIMRLLQPYFDLIDYWKELGYKPKQIKY